MSVNRRHLLAGFSGLVGLAAAEAAFAGHRPHGSPVPPIAGGPSSIPFARAPSGGWNGNKGTGYGTAPIPSSMVGATAEVEMPVGHFLTPPHQPFAADFTVYCTAFHPSGISKVEWFVENDTPTIGSTVGRRDIPYADLTTKPREVSGITLKYSDWSAHLTGSGLNVYAKITAVDGTVTARTLGPLRLKPMPLVNGLPNDYVALVTPDGKDDAGATVSAPSNGAVFTTLAAAEAALTTGAGGAAIAPMIKFMKTATYEIGTRDPTAFAYNLTNQCWWTLTHAPGVVATVGRASAPDYTNEELWPWLCARGMPEFRGPGIILDHKNWSYAKTESSPAWWDNGCKHTVLGVSAVTDPASGIASVAYNTYWNAGPHPANGAPHNLVVSDPGICATAAAYEYCTAGVASQYTLMVDGCTFKETTGDPFDANRFAIYNYLKGQVTSFFNPGILDAFRLQYTGANATATVARDGSNNLILKDGSTHTIPLGQHPGDANYTPANLAATINALTGWVASVTAAGTASGFGARWIQLAGSETSFGDTDAKTAQLHMRFQQGVHTELIHNRGFDWEDGSGTDHVDNVEFVGNWLQPPARFGSGDWFTQNRLDNSRFTNNLIAVSVLSGNTYALTPGLNLTCAHNYLNDAEFWVNTFIGGRNTQYRSNISEGLSGTSVTSLTGVSVLGNLTGGTSLAPFDASNKLLSPTDITNLFVDAANGNYLPGASSVIPSNRMAPVEAYDMFMNLRDPANDNPGPISKNQVASTAGLRPF